MHHYVIRHCDGNKAAWLLVRLHPDTKKEMDSFGSCTTAMSIDSLLKYAGHLKPQTCDKVELRL
jgi:hypothetical protein